MAHVPGERVMKEMAKSASKAGASEKMGKGMMRGMMDGMMGEGMMGPMMGGMMGEGMMGGMMKEGMMGPMMGEMMKEGMMGPMMGGMMKEGMMGGMMNGGMMGAMAPQAGMAMRGAAAGAAASVAARPGRPLVRKILGNPWVVLGLGVAAGYLIHKYRKDIIASASGLGGATGVGTGQTLEDVAGTS